MKIHFIAIGGSVMNNLAIALTLQGYQVTGSDDEVFEPAKSNLTKYGLLPSTFGWNPSLITNDLDAVVLGMHAKADNPELLKARKLGLKIFSFPEFLFDHAKNKTRVVIAGSHGKTSITAMVMHIMKKNNRDFDYMVGSAVKGFDITVRLSNDAPMMIFEGDEYPDSAINETPKFHIYQPDIALVSGIAWDHINVFPTFESYVTQFRKFVELISPDGALIFNSEDELVRHIAESMNPAIKKIPYSTPAFEITEGQTFLIRRGEKIPLKIFGRHNLQNMMGAVEICKCFQVDEESSLEAMKDFTGAARRLELILQTEGCSVFRDFAHAPSKLKATITAVKEQFPRRKLVACFELHTYSSLNQDFLNEYSGTMEEADIKIVFCDTHTFELKRMKPLDAFFIKKSFGNETIHVFTEKDSLKKFLDSHSWNKSNLLLMSSGNFGGLELNEIATFATAHQ